MARTVEIHVNIVKQTVFMVTTCPREAFHVTHVLQWWKTQKYIVFCLDNPLYLYLGEHVALTPPQQLLMTVTYHM